MSVTNNTANFPGPNAPIDQAGEVILSQPWFQFFLALLARTGGNGTPSGDFASLLAAIQAAQAQADFQSVVMQDQAVQEALRRIAELAAEILPTPDLRWITIRLDDFETRLQDASPDLRAILTRLDEHDSRFLDQAGAPVSPSLEQWNSPTLLNLWTYYGSPFNTPGYWKDPHGVVHLRGMLKPGSYGVSMFQLPIGYRPIGQELIGVDTFGTADQIGRIEVQTDGNVIARNGGSTFLTIDNVTFRAAQ